jgi:hypothetical protein
MHPNPTKAPKPPTAVTAPFFPFLALLLTARFKLPNVKDHRAGGIDYCEAGIALVAGSGASPCWAIIVFLNLFSVN